MEKEQTVDFGDLDPNFKYEVSSQPGGENVKQCFHCGICAVSCPVRRIDNDYNPRKIIRMILYGMKKELLSSETIWKCVHCHTCYERCPQNVKFAEVVEALKILAIRELEKGNIEIKGPTFLFDSTFADSIRHYGRVFETGLMTKYILKRKDLKFMLSYFPLGLKMVRKRKLSLFPKKVKDLKEIDKLFKETQVM